MSDHRNKWQYGADVYTSLYDEKIADPNLKPLRMGYRTQKNEAQTNFLDGCEFVSEVLEERIMELEGLLREVLAAPKASCCYLALAKRIRDTVVQQTTASEEKEK